MGKKKSAFMPIQEIRRLSALSLAELEKELVGQQPQLAEHMQAFLKSFHMADAVALAGWKMMKALEAGAIEVETVAELKDALSKYSPGNFNPASYTKVVACHMLESAYDRISSSANPAEELFQVIEEMKKEAGIE